MVVVCAMAKRRMYINVARRYVKMHSESFYRLTGWLAESRFRGYPEYINDFHEWKTHFLCPVVQCIRTVLPIIQFIAGMIH